MLRILDAKHPSTDDKARTARETKFPQADVIAKNQLRRLRRQQKWTIEEGAKRLGLTRKQLEDLETTKDYGCHVKWQHIYNASRVFGVSPDVFLGQGSPAGQRPAMKHPR